MKKIKVHIDPRGYNEKPSNKEIGGIKARLQKNTRPSLVTLEELVQKIETGHSISPGIMDGMSAKDWQEQQLFLVDIDNEEDGPILRVKDARAICRDNGLPLAFYYQTFSHTKEHPKFRLAFVMDKPITDEGMRKHIMETLANLFPQSDKSCVNADRIFHGTNKSAKLLNENARISCENIEGVSFPTHPEEHRSGHSSHMSGRSDPELDELVKNFDLFGYLKERNGAFRRTSKGVVFDDCEICRHHGNLMYVKETNTFCCRSKDVGGSIIDYLIHAEGLTKAQAIHKFKHELCAPAWKPPIPFEEVKLPPFPVEALPAPLCDWVQAVAENTETPVDMAAVCALASLSCAVQGKFKIFPKGGYGEPLNLYILIIANSGERKSPIVRLMTRPIYQYEDMENRRRKALMEVDLANLSIWKKQIDALERDGKAEEATKLRAQCRELEDKRMKPLRLIADDITPEALTSLLSENKGVLTIISTEGGLFDTLAGRYSNTVSIDTMLKAYSGDRIRVDRKGRESEVINDPALTMLLSAQDNVLEGLMRNDVFKSRGLNARILYCRPKSKMGTRHFDTPELSTEMEREYRELMHTLLQIPYPEGGAPKTISLSPKAYKRVDSFFDWLEPQLVDNLEHMDGWGAKFIGNTLRIAGLLHCAVNKHDSADIAVSLDTMNRAIKIGKYFMRHALCAYSIMGADKALRGAKQILKRLQGQDKRELTKYQIHRLCRGEFPRVEDTIPAIELLVEHGYLRERTYPAPTGGRPRANGYILNPLLFDK
ncbi:YfjI family protein [Intestinimonas butyriciproducens]|uniref:YfjI family protein n=1 Tax=Intestinimonas butyriciproducens TaxID=1297617 RepID=UPI0018AB8794|nr:YfjI family protein [Intestinimonas butyriciproducens]MDB7817147.1 YfjI family protein [Intestinimonas butyriciproducens]MDB7843691.1 YfjI family protein [Intestinimonas butyriciproducens]MDB7858171.1 YfjI family protein [Intestinimonas butyriciproducens]